MTGEILIVGGASIGARSAAAGVLEIVDDYDGDTDRAVYTVRFAEAVYMLHAFQKKSKRGIATPKQEIDWIKRRLAAAQADYRGRTRGA